ncbi:MAG TPA: hypothetical protein VMT75_02515 [Candidatus Saccharimonadales bacterium]|nr:hypothetical protein [Candidatus Saccharimonadales bacterium]
MLLTGLVEMRDDAAVQVRKAMNFVRVSNAVLTAVLVFAFGSISIAKAQDAKPQSAKPAATAKQQAAPTAEAVDEVEVLTVTATVQKIDLPTRTVTLLLEDGTTKTFKVDKSVRNLAQVKAGDKLKISYTEELIVAVGKSKQVPSAAAGSAVGVAPKGAKPGIVMVDTTAISAKIVAVDAANHTVTLVGPEGNQKAVKLSKKVTDLNQLKAGETVDLILTQSLVVEVVK